MFIKRKEDPLSYAVRLKPEYMFHVLNDENAFVDMKEVSKAMRMAYKAAKHGFFRPAAIICGKIVIGFGEYMEKCREIIDKREPVEVDE